MMPPWRVEYQSGRFREGLSHGIKCKRSPTLIADQPHGRGRLKKSALSTNQPVLMKAVQRLVLQFSVAGYARKSMITRMFRPIYGQFHHHASIPPPFKVQGTKYPRPAAPTLPSLAGFTNLAFEVWHRCAEDSRFDRLYRPLVV